MNYGSSKSAKIVLSKSIFNVKNQLNFSKKKLRLRPNILSKRLGDGNECKDGGAPLNVREEKHKLFLGPGPTFTLDRLKRSLMAC